MSRPIASAMEDDFDVLGGRGARQRDGCRRGGSDRHRRRIDPAGFVARVRRRADSPGRAGHSAIRAELSIPISIDTTRTAVAAAALDAGADLVNDISAGRDDPALLPLVARRKVPIILMHMQGTPATMQINPTYTDVVCGGRDFLFERLTYARTMRHRSCRCSVGPRHRIRKNRRAQSAVA